MLPNNFLRGLYHVSSKPISKFKLLKLVKKEYGSSVKIEPNDTIFIDRSLISRLQVKLVIVSEWITLVKMRDSRLKKQHV